MLSIEILYWCLWLTVSSEANDGLYFGRPFFPLFCWYRIQNCTVCCVVRIQIFAMHCGHPAVWDPLQNLLRHSWRMPGTLLNAAMLKGIYRFSYVKGSKWIIWPKAQGNVYFHIIMLRFAKAILWCLTKKVCGLSRKCRKVLRQQNRQHKGRPHTSNETPQDRDNQQEEERSRSSRQKKHLKEIMLGEIEWLITHKGCTNGWHDNNKEGPCTLLEPALQLQPQSQCRAHNKKQHNQGRLRMDQV